MGEKRQLGPVIEETDREDSGVKSQTRSLSYTDENNNKLTENYDDDISVQKLEKMIMAQIFMTDPSSSIEPTNYRFRECRRLSTAQTLDKKKSKSKSTPSDEKEAKKL